MYRSTQIKTTYIDKALLEFMGLLAIEMANRAREDDEDPLKLFNSLTPHQTMPL